MAGVGRGFALAGVMRAMRAVLFGALLGALAGGVWPAWGEVLRPVQGKVAARELTVVNGGKRPVFQLRVSPSDAEQWGEDRLGEATILPGGRFRVPLGRIAACLFDVQVIYDNLGQEERRSVDVCRSRALSFDGAGVVLPPDPFAAARRVVMANRAGRVIQQVFVSPPSAEQWGDDVVPGQGIAPGATGEVSYRGGCVVDMRVVFDNRAAEERRNVDVCRIAGVTIRPGWTTADEVQPAPAAGQEDVTLLNRTGLAITELYLRPQGAGERTAEEEGGADMLGNDVLPAGGRMVVPFSRGVACRFVARMFHGGDRGQSEQRDIDLCRTPMIRLGKAQDPG